MVGLTRALHIAMNDNEREAALALRAKFMAQVEELSLSPTGESPTLGRPRKRLTDAERNELTERDALIGRPDEIIRRIKRLQEAGVEYVMVIDFAGSLDHLRTFAREVDARLRLNRSAGVPPAETAFRPPAYTSVLAPVRW